MHGIDQQIGTECAAALLEKPTSQSPIQNVPYDVLRHIFGFLEDWNKLSNCKSDRGHCPGLALAAVCNYWRAVAFSMHGFWTKIFFRLRGDKEYRVAEADCCPLTYAVCLLLERSFDRALEICLDLGWQLESIRHPAFTALLESHNRWRWLQAYDFRYPEVWCLNRGEDVSGIENLQMLECVSLKVMMDAVEPLCLNAPNLRAIQFNWDEDWNLPAELQGSTFPNIKSLSITSHVAKWSSLLELFPNVETILFQIALSDYFSPDIDNIPDEPLELPPSCRTLILKAQLEDSLLARTLDLLHGPNVEILIIRALTPYEVAEEVIDSKKHFLNELMDFIGNTGGSFKRLELQNMPHISPGLQKNLITCMYGMNAENQVQQDGPSCIVIDSLGENMKCTELPQEFEWLEWWNELGVQVV
jgi:hypothetical protein